VAGLRTARNLGASRALLNTNERIHSTLYIARLLPIFEVFRSEAEALQALA
jgi:anti-anti-sigma regulatory factor